MIWLFLCWTVICSSYPVEDMDVYREKAKEMFYHGFESYMNYAFPDDELKPLSCAGRKHEKRGTLDDIIGE